LVLCSFPVHMLPHDARLTDGCQSQFWPRPDDLIPVMYCFCWLETPVKRSVRLLLLKNHLCCTVVYDECDFICQTICNVCRDIFMYLNVFVLVAFFCNISHNTLRVILSSAWVSSLPLCASSLNGPNRLVSSVYN